MTDPPPLRVLLVLGRSEGGIAAHVRSLAIELAARTVRVTVVGPADTLRRLDLDSRSIRVTAAPVGEASPWAVWVTFRRLRRETAGADVVHAHGLRATLSCIAATRRRPLVATWHNAPPGRAGRRPLHQGLERIAARAAAVTLAASEDLTERARRAGAGDRARSTFVSAPPLPPPTRTPAQVRAELGVADRQLVLGVGRLHEQKRWDVLIDASRRWASQPNGPAVVIAGDGPLAQALADRVADVAAPVRFLGRRADVSDLLAAADVVALPSSWEARALVAQEALAAGVPLVTTAVGGLVELVGDAALLVPPGDAVALGAALDAVLADEGLRDVLRDRGLARAAQWPDTKANAQALIDLYLTLRSSSEPATA